MKFSFVIAIFAFALFGFADAADQLPDQQLLAALKEIQTQQAQMAANQAKIEAKLAEVAEAVRIARIYSSRGGAGNSK